MLVGLVARLNPVYSIQSAKSVYPLAIANCKENRFIINFYSMLPKYFFSFAWHGYELFTTHSIDTFPFKLFLLKACSFVYDSFHCCNVGFPVAPRSDKCNTHTHNKKIPTHN